jgi:hypothetical protein
VQLLADVLRIGLLLLRMLQQHAGLLWHQRVKQFCIDGGTAWSNAPANCRPLGRFPGSLALWTFECCPRIPIGRLSAAMSARPASLIRELSEELRAAVGQYSPAHSAGSFVSLKR